MDRLKRNNVHNHWVTLVFTLTLLLSVGMPATNVFALSLSDPVGSLTNTVGSTLPPISTPVPSLTNTVTSTLTATNENIVLNNVQSKSGMTSLTNHMTLSSFNAGTGTDRLLVVGISANDINAVAVTFGGIPLTQAVSSFSNHDSEFWYLKNPSGTANIVITMAGSAAAVVGAYAFSGVDQADPIPTTATNFATVDSNPSISLITKFPNSWILDLPSIGGGVTLGSPTCTQQWNINRPDIITGASSSRMAAFPAVVTCNWTASGSGAPWNDAAIEVKAAGSSILGLNVGVSPSPPTNLVANTVSISQINLSWTAPSINTGDLIVTGYQIERSTDSGTTWSTIVANTGSTDTTYSDTGLDAGTTYMYRVSAINAVGTSSPSNTASVTTQTASSGITVYAHRIPASYWDPCFATQCSAGTGPGASMYIVLYDSSGNVVQTGFSDENGYTFSGLNSSATYYVYPDDCDNCHGAPHDVVFQYWGDDHSSTRPRAATVGTSLDAWYSCTNGCSGGP